MIRAPYVYTYILKVIWMIQEVEEGHGYDEETIIYVKDWTGKTLAECMTTARDRKNWRELVRLRPSAMKTETDDDNESFVQRFTEKKPYLFEYI